MGNQLDWVREDIRSSIEVKVKILSDDDLLSKINKVAIQLFEASRRGNRIIFAGNGGSAADAQHLAAEFVSRFAFDRPGLPSMSLSTDTSMITAIGNDYGYDNLFVRQLQAQARDGDVFVGITTSGKSRNILMAFDACKALGVTSIALCGSGGELEKVVDYIIRVPSISTPRIQEAHILIGHMLCSYVENNIFPGLRPS